jgi:hypothetical protein
MHYLTINTINMKQYILYLCFIIGLSSCQKYLDQKPDKSLVVPETIQDLQAILNNTATMNASNPFSGEIASDDSYMVTADWQARTTTEQQAYIWGKDLFNDNERNDWSLSYTAIYYANVVLDELAKDKYNTASQADKNNIRGQALFFRAWYNYQLLQLFAKPYDAATATTDLGIPLRLSSDLNIPTKRSSIAVCYEQLNNDLVESSTLLPITQPYLTLPNKMAAQALLAKVHLLKGQYQTANNLAQQALQTNNTLLDYNQLTTTASAPIARFNAETIFFSAMIVTSSLSIVGKIDSTLYNSYPTNDLRKVIYFKTNTDGSVSFKGSYDGSARLFNGIARDELYLIVAETYARLGDTDNALSYLNQLLIKRWKTGSFVPVTATTTAMALDRILQERRKELLLRGIRRTDLRRLNKEAAYATTLTRIVDNQTYTLPPNDTRYTMPIPVAIVQLTGIEQNP